MKNLIDLEGKNRTMEEYLKEHQQSLSDILILRNKIQPTNKYFMLSQQNEL